MADVGTTELSHRQQHGFVEKPGGAIGRKPDRNSVGPEDTSVRDKDWDPSRMHQSLSNQPPITEDDLKPDTEGASHTPDSKDAPDSDDAHLWLNVSQGQGKVTWDPEAEDRVFKHEDRITRSRWLLEKLHLDRDH